MSGHSGYVSINAPRQQPNLVQDPGLLEGVPPAGQGPVANEEPAKDFHAIARESFGTSALVKDLDIMLAKAAASARSGLSEQEIKAAFKHAKLDHSDREALKGAADKAKEAMQQLDKLTGAQLAKAMVKKMVVGKNDEWTMEWDENNPAGEAVKAAMDAQQELSDVLAGIIKRLPKGVSLKGYEILEEAMFQADRRVAEVDTLVMQITQVAETGIGMGDVDFESEASLNRTMGDLADEKAFSMHDNDVAMKALKATLDPVSGRLERYAEDSSANVSSAEFKAFTGEIARMKSAIASARKLGYVNVKSDGTVAIPGKKDKSAGVRVFVDRKFLELAEEAVEKATERLGRLKSDVVRSTVNKFIRNDLPWLRDPIFNPAFSKHLRAIGGCKLNAISTIAENLGRLHAALKRLAESPDNAKVFAARELAGELRNVCKSDVKSVKALTEALSHVIPKSVPAEDAPDDFKKAHKAFAEKVKSDGDYVKGLVRNITRRIAGIRPAIEHIVAMCFDGQRMKEDALRTSGAVREVFRGERNFSSLVEARVHGYEDGDVNADLDDVNAVSSEELGSGSFNSVSLVKYKNGDKYVFKPEVAGRLLASGTDLQTSLRDEQQMTRVNMAVQKTADALGLGDVMVKTTAGTHKGTFGMFMEKAPGVTAVDFQHGKTEVVPENERDPAAPKPLDKFQVADLPENDLQVVWGRLMRASNRLQWFDVITGQGDRHANNYIVDVRDDLSVSLKGIDNDASYGVIRTGLFKFNTGTIGAAGRLTGWINQYCNRFFEEPDEKKEEMLTFDEGLYECDDGRYELDLSKLENKVSAAFFGKSLGLKSMSVPQEMDRDLYDRLVALKSGSARKSHLAEIRKRLGEDSPQFKAAVTRLDEAIKYAEGLMKEGRVYSTDQWETQECQRAIASRQPKEEDMLSTKGMKHTDELDNVKANMFYVLSDNFVFRDMLKSDIMPGYLKHP